MAITTTELQPEFASPLTGLVQSVQNAATDLCRFAQRATRIAGNINTSFVKTRPNDRRRLRTFRALFIQNQSSLKSGTRTLKGLLGFQHGGIVPGTGRGDTVPIMAEPGEMIIPRQFTHTVRALMGMGSQSRELMRSVSLGFRRMFTGGPQFGRAMAMGRAAGTGWRDYRSGDFNIGGVNINALSPNAIRDQLLPELERMYRRGQARPPWMNR